MKKLRLILGVIYLLSPFAVFAQQMNYQSFDNSRLSRESNSVRFFLQDKQALMWIGTDKGLYSFDGYESFPHFTPGSSENRVINCALFYKDDFLLLGTEGGLLLYNYKFDKYVPFEIKFTGDVTAMVRSKKDLWIGCSNGLYRYNFAKKELTKMPISPVNEVKEQIVSALLEDQGFIYVGTFGKFGRVSIENHHYEQIESSPRKRRMVNALLKDTARNCIWLGEGNSLTKYTPSSNSFKSITGFPVVKTIGLDRDNSLLLGTDNGLYLYNENETKHFVHNAQKLNSLANNIVGSIFRDRSDNIWLGTDFDLSMVPHQRKFEFFPIPDFSGIGAGNQFYTIFRDSKRFYWLGGDNGLIRTRQLTTVDKTFRWYNMGDPDFHIPHNRIRDVYEDSEHNLWVATDFGVCKYDYKIEKFIIHNIFNNDTTKNANWAYQILEDHRGNLWISSYNGGLFKIKKAQLLSDQHLNIAEAHYDSTNGLSSNNIDQVVFDKKGNIWILNRNKGVDVINANSDKVTQFPILSYSAGNIPNFMINDSVGNVWIGFRNGVAKIDPAGGVPKVIAFEGADNALVKSLLEVGNNIWITTTEGLWIISKVDLSTNHINIGNKLFYSSYYDAQSGKILFGGADGIAICPPLISRIKTEKHQIIISSILVDGKKYVGGSNELSVRYKNSVDLSYKQNNISVEFSDFQYSKENRDRTYIFKLDNDSWTSLKANENAIYFNKLDPGTYTLTIGERASKEAKAEILKSFKIIIHPPWYYTDIAKVVYLIIIIGLILWVINFFHQKNRLKFERMEKVKTLEQTKLKIDFFTNIAHEFKTPLTLIIAPLGELIHSIKNTKDRTALEMIHQNAMKLNSLVHQAIDYYREDSKVPIGLVRSRVEFVEFAKSVFSNYAENKNATGLEFIFNTNCDEIFVDIDVLKIESVLNNLLSNACKYTNPPGSIILSLDYSAKESNLVIKVSDTGVGIPEKDLPYIFQRFFQSSSNNAKEGTGIGLYLVKSFVELHGGSVSIRSGEDEGASFIVSIPVPINNAVQFFSADEIEPVAENEKPLIIIVEDNVAIANFVYTIFAPEFRCVVAHNGKTGLKICSDLMPDIIISDVLMPVMDGLEMCHLLKRNIPTSTIPIVLLTAKDDQETELRSINLKIDAYVAKPFDASILYSRVKQLLAIQVQRDRKTRIEDLTTPLVKNVASVDEKFLSFITKTIEDRIADPELSVSALCELAHVTQKQLYRKVKQLTGLTTVEYIKSIRMKKAAVLLSNKNFTIAEVMYMVGFSNHSYFARCFYATFGKTPRQAVDAPP
jgi:signal transduction histidine kinase/ligand-binding sensor domain-containing protein/CheY-like chemotaxis protein/AraC-like DNA-binding protein